MSSYRSKLSSLVFAASLFGFAQAAAAGVTDIPASDLQSYLHSHERAVVLFNSPDPHCQFCGAKADRPFERASSRFSGQIPFARVEWSPWQHFPQAVVAMKIRAVPVAVAFLKGRIIDIHGGVIGDVGRYNAHIEQRFHAAEAAAAAGTQPRH